MMITDLIPSTTYNIGDTWQWSITLGQYPSASWTLGYALKTVGKSPIIITSTANTDAISHDIKVTSATTATYTPGLYKASIYITSSDSEKITLGTIDIILLPNLSATTSDYDPRSYNQICLDALELTLQGAVTRDYLETVFKDSTFKYKSTMELIKLRNYFKREVESENGIKPGRIIYR